MTAAKMVVPTGKPEIECAFCFHDYDSHNPDAADRQRGMPCTECPDGICRAPRLALLENPAETLRRAAALMRERAEAATPGPWRPVAGLWRTETFAAVIGPKGVPDDAGTWLMATGRGAASQEADADHAASWHPLVALAVADCLDAAATAWETGDVGWGEALAVARAYLGQEGS